jgi:hypothetical protein
MAVGSGSVASPVKVPAVAVQTPPTHTLIPVLPAAIATAAYQTTQLPTAVVNIDSSPEGALVTFDGFGTLTKTPHSWHMTPGWHTFLLTHDGYQDYTVTLNLAANSVTPINAPLKSVMGIGALRQNVSAVGTISSGIHLNSIPVAATMMTPVPDTICVSGEHCLTAADAALYYQSNSGYNVDEVCGYTGINYTVPKYCSWGIPSPITSLNCLSGEYCLTNDEADATLAPGWQREMENKGGVLCDWGGTDYAPVPKYCIIGTPKMSGLQPGAIQSVAVANQITRIPVSSGTTRTTAPGVTKKPPGGRRQTGVVESIFGFFGGFFTPHPVCPVNQTACNGKCVDVSADPQNCGSCDYLCYDPAVCIQGQCTEPGLPQPDVGNLL